MFRSVDQTLVCQVLHSAATGHLCGLVSPPALHVPTLLEQATLDRQFVIPGTPCKTSTTEPLLPGNLPSSSWSLFPQITHIRSPGDDGYSRAVFFLVPITEWPLIDPNKGLPGGGGDGARL